MLNHPVQFKFDDMPAFTLKWPNINNDSVPTK